MSLVIEECKGHIHVIGTALSPGGTTGFYQMDPALPDGEGSKSILMGIPLGFREIVQPSVTLDDKRSLYVFGSAWNEASVTGWLLLGEQSTKGALLGAVVDWYQKNRVSKKKGPVQLSMGTAAVDAFVVGLRFDAADPKFNKQAFSIIFVTADIKNTG